MRLQLSSSISLSAILSAAGLLATAAPAQVDRGSAAPSFDFAAALNDAPPSFSALAGKVVLLDFFATW